MPRRGPSLLASARWIAVVPPGSRSSLVSAAAFGSGSLFAQPVYASGVDWLGLSAWRFLFGAGLAWTWVALSPARRRGLRALDRRQLAVIAIALGVLFTGNSGTYYAGARDGLAGLAGLIVYMYPVFVAVLSIRFAPAAARAGGAWIALGHRARRRRPGPRRHRPDRGAAGQRRHPAGRRVVAHLRGLDHRSSARLVGRAAGPARERGYRPTRVGPAAAATTAHHDDRDGRRLSAARGPRERPAGRCPAEIPAAPGRVSSAIGVVCDVHRDPGVLRRGAADRRRPGRRSSARSSRSGRSSSPRSLFGQP